jgi:dihydrodipicolinate synthase/N-acetylneuraminate lyase
VPRGIYCPTITFFKNDSDQDLDLDRQSEHIRYILQSGVHGIVVHGTTGESVLLSHEERNTITRLVAKTRQELNRSNVSLVVGCPAQSTREVLKMCRDAKDNGADFALVLPPSYWAKAVTPAVIEQFFCEVADKAPLPIIIYSFPAVTAGVDMDSDLLAKLAKHPVSFSSTLLPYYRLILHHPKTKKLVSLLT